MTARHPLPVSNPGIGADDAPFNSAEWADSVRAHLHGHCYSLPRAAKSVASYVDMLRQTNGWEHLNKPDGSRFSSLEEFCEHRRPWGLGLKLADLEWWTRASGPASAPMYWNPANGESNTETPEIHEAATMFDMLPEPALEALAANIKANGLREPIVLWQGKVIDGRNRLAACERADITPTFTTLAHCPDPVAYVMSANLHRRHLTHLARVRLAWSRKAHWQAWLKARQVEAGAEGSKGGRGKKASKTLVGNPPQGFSEPLLKWFDLAAKETGVKGDAVKTYDEVRGAECPELTALVDAEGMALDPASKLAREVTRKNLTAKQLAAALAKDGGRAILDGLKKPRAPKPEAGASKGNLAPKADKDKPAEPAVDTFAEKIAAAPDLATIGDIVGEVGKATAAGKLSDPDNTRLTKAVDDRKKALVAPPAQAEQSEAPAPLPAPPSSGQTAPEPDAPAVAPRKPADDLARLWAEALAGYATDDTATQGFLRGVLLDLTTGHEAEVRRALGDLAQRRADRGAR